MTHQKLWRHPTSDHWFVGVALGEEVFKLAMVSVIEVPSSVVLDSRPLPCRREVHQALAVDHVLLVAVAVTVTAIFVRPAVPPEPLHMSAMRVEKVGDPGEMDEDKSKPRRHQRGQ